METISDATPDGEPEPRVTSGRGFPQEHNLPSRQSLPAKGTCWYCEKPLDSVKRFCGKGCADAFDEEAEFSR